MSRIDGALRRARQQTDEAVGPGPDIDLPMRPGDAVVGLDQYQAESYPSEEYPSESLAPASTPTAMMTPSIAAPAAAVRAVPAPVPPEPGFNRASPPAAAPAAQPDLPLRTPAPAPVHPEAAAPARQPIVVKPENPVSQLDERLLQSTTMIPVAIEQYRRLAAVLHQAQADRGLKVVMVTSAMAGEGKTFTTANLVVTLAESFKRRVLLIDADLRRPSVHQMFHLSNASGLNEGLNAAEDRKLPIVQVSPYLSVLPAGEPNQDPMGPLTSPRMRRIVDEAKAAFDWVVIDTPPIALLPDANLLGELADGVVFVIGAGSTPFAMIQRAIKAIDRSRLLGVVLNRAAETQTSYHYYRYYGAVKGATPGR